MDAREMILAEDRLVPLDAFRAVNSCPQVHLAGEMYKRPKFPDESRNIRTVAEPQGDRRGTTRTVRILLRCWTDVCSGSC